MVGQAERQVQQVGEYHLRDRRRAVSRDVRNGNSSLFRSVGVDDVIPGRQDPDVAELRQTIQHLPGEDRLVRQNDLGLLGPVDDLVRLRSCMNLQISQGRQPLPREVARIERISVQYDDIHRWFHSFV